MDKKAQMGGGRKIISFILGLIFVALGLIPLLNMAGVIGFALPSLPAFLFWILALIGGIYLLIDAYKEKTSFGLSQFIMWSSLLIGLLIFAFGVIPILFSLGFIGFNLPAVGQVIIDIIFTIAGILLIIGSFMGF